MGLCFPPIFSSRKEKLIGICSHERSWPVGGPLEIPGGSGLTDAVFGEMWSHKIAWERPLKCVCQGGEEAHLVFVQCFHYVDFIRRALQFCVPLADYPVVCLEGLETSLLSDAELNRNPWEEYIVCVHTHSCTSYCIALWWLQSFSRNLLRQPPPHLYILSRYIKIRQTYNHPKIFFKYFNIYKNINKIFYWNIWFTVLY